MEDSRVPKVYVHIQVEKSMVLYYFYWLIAYHYGTLLPSTGPLPTLLSSRLHAYPYDTLLYSTGSLPIHVVLYYLLLAPCLSLLYSTVFYWVGFYTYDALLPSTGPLHILMVLYYLLLAHCLYLWYSTIFYWPLPISMELLSSTAPGLSICYLLLDPCFYLWYSTTFYWLPDYPYGTLLFSTGPFTITIVLAHLLLAHCLLYYPLRAPCPSL